MVRNLLWNFIANEPIQIHWHTHIHTHTHVPRIAEPLWNRLQVRTTARLNYRLVRHHTSNLKSNDARKFLGNNGTANNKLFQTDINVYYMRHYAIPKNCRVAFRSTKNCMHSLSQRYSQRAMGQETDWAKVKTNMKFIIIIIIFYSKWKANTSNTFLVELFV